MQGETMAIPTWLSKGSIRDMIKQEHLRENINLLIESSTNATQFMSRINSFPSKLGKK
jgi:hypothetical protein